MEKTIVFHTFWNGYTAYDFIDSVEASRRSRAFLKQYGVSVECFGAFTKGGGGTISCGRVEGYVLMEVGRN